MSHTILKYNFTVKTIHLKKRNFGFTVVELWVSLLPIRPVECKMYKDENQ
jgi:hypothetical protein